MISFVDSAVQYVCMLQFQGLLLLGVPVYPPRSRDMKLLASTATPAVAHGTRAFASRLSRRPSPHLVTGISALGIVAV